ncbi:MAG: response regulator [Lachnospiraceae bacterium]|nr:response regulator [Lachnospiraceae bacterium]
MNDKIKILVIDDDKIQLNQAGEMLRTKYEVFLVKSAEAGMKILMKKEKPDMILLDISMPEMDGFEAIQKIKQIEDCEEIPVIFLTAMDGSSSEIKGLELGAVDYVTKPFVKEILLLRIAKHLAVREKSKELTILKQGKDILEFDPEKIKEAEKILTEQELAIAKLIVSGRSNQQIAEYMGLSYQHIKNRAHSINEKYGIKKREELRSYFVKE